MPSAAAACATTSRCSPKAPTRAARRSRSSRLTGVRDGIGDALGSVRAAIETLRHGHQDEQSRYTLLMVEVQEAMSKMFIGLGLTDRQEAQLIDLIQAQMERLRERQEFDQQVATQIEALGQSLRALASR